MLDGTRKFSLVDESNKEMKRTLTTVYDALKEKGYNPINQIVGYLLSEDPTYITNHNNARSLICKIDRDELMQELRAQGQNDASKIAYGVLETNGQLSLILTGSEQPATASMLGAAPVETGYAHIIINDGRILDKNLALLGRDRRWLENELKRRKIKSADEVYILTLSEMGNVFCQLKED